MCWYVRFVFSLEFGIGYLGFGSVFLLFVNVYSAFWSVSLVLRECFVVLLIVIVEKYKTKFQVICEIARWLLPIMGRSRHQVEILSQ